MWQHKSVIPVRGASEVLEETVASTSNTLAYTNGFELNKINKCKRIFPDAFADTFSKISYGENS